MPHYTTGTGGMDFTATPIRNADLLLCEVLKSLPTNEREPCLNKWFCDNTRLNLLLVEDHSDLSSMLASFFESPFLSVNVVSTLRAARQVLRKAAVAQHCWVLDVDLAGEDGLTLLDEFPDKAFAIVYSGVRSLEDGARAHARGALAVIDKSQDSLPALAEAVCRIAPLGYIACFRDAKWFPVYHCLASRWLTSTEQWAEAAHICLRRLQRLCALANQSPPRHTLLLYYGTYWRLRKSIALALRLPELPPGANENTGFFMEECSQRMVARNESG